MNNKSLNSLKNFDLDEYGRILIEDNALYREIMGASSLHEDTFLEGGCSNAGCGANAGCSNVGCGD